ncbi:Sodium/proton antiporter 1 (AtNHD1) (Na(+)/H(+) antiporter 1) [Durusdinium trenchii]|uniref:Sodium/proton antiporter 1 (AtNHD1) (Na(+)/H(+) antiporter 1) n=1 Tax=Durusdinium trenchii TaxID=1381693 RepID=A0ABP0NDM2_9DINO
MVLQNVSVPRAKEVLGANLDLLGLSPMEVFDKTVSALTDAGLLVILNNHVSSAGWCCSGSDGEGLWHTERYPEEDWLRGIQLVARRYQPNPRVVGFDLRNEVRADGITLPTWGSGDLLTDWSIAAVKGAKRVLREQPDLLIVVSGIHFGMRLSEVPNRPIHEEVPELRNRTVYTTHFYYGWSFDMMAYDMLSKHIPVMMFFAVWLWFLLAADHKSQSSRDLQVLAAEQECLETRWELHAAAAVLALQACLFLIGEHLGQSCGHIHIVSPPAFVVLSSFCFRINYLIWARILLAYTLVAFTNLSNKDSRWRYSRPLEALDDHDMRRAAPWSCKRSLLAFCASEILVEPLRERKRSCAVGALSLLLLMVLVGGKCGSYGNFRGELDACLGPLLSGDGVTPAPVWLSEFGTDVRDNYFNNIIRYMKENKLDFAYWSINGEKRSNESETYGLLQVLKLWHEAEEAEALPLISQELVLVYKETPLLERWGMGGKCYCYCWFSRAADLTAMAMADLTWHAENMMAEELRRLIEASVKPRWTISPLQREDGKGKKGEFQTKDVEVPFLTGNQYEYFPIIATFIAGYGVIVLEEQTEINKADNGATRVVFFLLGALTIVEIMDAHKGFDIITKAIQAKSQKELLIIIGVLTFVLSSVLNNLTVVIVMISLLQKLVKDEDFRMKLGGLVVVASNAGGAWSYEYLQMEDKPFDRDPSSAQDDEVPNGQAVVFWGGLFGMITVPVFTAITQCPAWSGMMLVLGLLGLITSLLHGPEDEKYSLKGALTRVEVPDALFFLGVLFAVGGLERVGLLKEFAVQLSTYVPYDALVAIFLGFASAIVDNVPLVAAAQGMYDLEAHPANDGLWNLITYCAATGGSLLVIGSAAGLLLAANNFYVYLLFLVFSLGTLYNQ